MRDPLREGGRWLRQADVDLEAARLLTPRFAALACFHAQQAAEKALKAILYGAGERIVLGHSLAELGAAVERHSADFAALAGEVAKLDRYYVPTRYPNALPGGDPNEAFDEADAESAIAQSERAIEHARGFLGERGR
jgi:HEPN domain-containing protein